MEINFQYLFNVIPDPVLIIDRTGKVVYQNVASKDIFRFKDEDDKIESLFLDKRKIKDSIHNLLSYHRVVELSSLIRLSNNEIKPYSLKLTILSDQNLLFLCLFNSLESKNGLFTQLLNSAFVAELNELRPYLNKSGKEIVDLKSKNPNFGAFFNQGIVAHQLDGIVTSEYYRSILARFAVLTDNEVAVCVLLSQGAGVRQISAIVSKNENATRVMLHRIVQKTNTGNIGSLKLKINEILNIK